MSIRKLVGLFNGKSNRPKIAYSSDGRSGHVHYQSAETSFAFYYEFGGGNCVATISIPGPATWEMETKLPLAHREEVLNFIGQQVVKDQTSSGTGYFKIEGDWLNIYTMILLILMIWVIEVFDYKMTEIELYWFDNNGKPLEAHLP